MVSYPYAQLSRAVGAATAVKRSARDGELQLELRRGRAHLTAHPVVVLDDLAVALVPREAGPTEFADLEAAGHELARCVGGARLSGRLLAPEDLLAGRLAIVEQAVEARVLRDHPRVRLVLAGRLTDELPRVVDRIRRRPRVGELGVVTSHALGGHAAEPGDADHGDRSEHEAPAPAHLSEVSSQVHRCLHQTVHQPLPIALRPVVPGQVLTRVNAII